MNEQPSQERPAIEHPTHPISFEPINDEYFEKLLNLGGELQALCHERGIVPVAYGSLAYAVYTEDNSVAINDIDFLVPEDCFPIIERLFSAVPGIRVEPTDYHSIKFYKGDIKIAFDATEHYLNDLDMRSNDVVINGRAFRIVDKATLKKVYQRGAETIPFKAEAYSSKLRRLNESV